MPEQPLCGAKNRAGEPCRRRATPGKRRCNLHGGKSTGPKTKAGKAKVATASMTHGARQTLASYEAHLAGDQPDLMAIMPRDTSVETELRFSRMKLARMQVYDPEGRETHDQQMTVLEQIRKLATTQNELRPGGDATGNFTVELRVVGGPPSPPSLTPVPEAGETACS